MTEKVREKCKATVSRKVARGPRHWMWALIDTAAIVPGRLPMVLRAPAVAVRPTSLLGLVLLLAGTVQALQPDEVGMSAISPATVRARASRRVRSP